MFLFSTRQKRSFIMIFNPCALLILNLNFVQLRNKSFSLFGFIKDVICFLKMGEPVALHDITGRRANVDDGTIYEIPAISKEDENGYMKINTLAESMTTSSHGTTRDHHTKYVEGDDVSKPRNDAATLRKIQLFCAILLALLIINSVTIGVFIQVIVSKNSICL